MSNDLETMDRIRYEAQVNVGSVISPFNAWQIFRGSVTFPLRMQRMILSIILDTILKKLKAEPE